VQALLSRHIAAHLGHLAPSRRGNAALRSPTSADPRQNSRFWMSATSRTIIVGGVLNESGYRADLTASSVTDSDRNACPGASWRSRPWMSDSLWVQWSYWISERLTAPLVAQLRQAQTARASSAAR
jgi:hypothetical protein